MVKMINFTLSTSMIIINVKEKESKGENLQFWKRHTWYGKLRGSIGDGGKQALALGKHAELQHTGNAEPWRFLDQTESLFLSSE